MTIPSVEREQLRDLVRCREDIRADLMRARHRLGKFLLRREIYWEGKGEAWSRKHRSWLTSIRFADQASRATFADYLHAHDVLVARRDQVEAERMKPATCAPCAQAVARLRCLRGIDRDRARAVRRDRRAAPVPSPRPARRRSRDRPVRAHHRQPAPARVDHQAGSTHAAGCRSRRRTTTAADRRSVSTSSAASAGSTGDHQHRLARAAPPQRPLAPAQRRPQETQSDRRGRDRPRARRLLLGDHHLDCISRQHSAGIPAGGLPLTHTPSNPRSASNNTPGRR